MSKEYSKSLGELSVLWVEPNSDSCPKVFGVHIASKKLDPFVVVVDLGTPNECAMNRLHAIHAAYENIPLLVLVTSPESRAWQALLGIGVGGVVVKPCQASEVLSRLTSLTATQSTRQQSAFGNKSIAGSESQFFADKPQSVNSSPVLSQTVFPRELTARLTGREVMIVCRLREGESPKQVAHQLGISVATVRRHQNHIYRKLGVRSILQALAKFNSMSFN